MSTPHVNALAPWRILIKGMGGPTGKPGKILLTLNAATRLWTREANGVIAEWTHKKGGPGGPYAVEKVVIPPNPLSDHLSGGSFYKLLEGPDVGWYVSFWSNEIGEPYPTGAAKWGDITVTETEDFDRGPGAVLATLGPGDIVPLPTSGRGTDPAHLVGANRFYNAGGEFHFTLLVDSPYINVPLPKRTHYAIEFWDADAIAWRETFAGWIWDFDATDTEAVFYGIDYLAATRFTLDERFNPAAPDAAAEVGSVYVQKTISEIVSSQLNYAVSRDNSIVGFIAVGSIASMPTKISKIYATFRDTLGFVVGLLDSWRAGTGKQTRLSVKKLDDVYTYVVEDDPGSYLDNLPLVYGDRVQGYRVIPFGDGWASRVNFISRDHKGLKVAYRTESSAVDQAQWGSIAQAPVFVETEDANDARRRALQAAIDASRFGRQISVGLRLGSFLPFEGYDICDNLPVDINHGAVTTKNWGSDAFGDDSSTETAGDPSAVQAAYWTILGVTWESYDDGHWMTGFSLLPRGGGHLVSEACIDAMPEANHYPLGTGFFGLNPSDGYSVYTRAGLGLPNTRDEAVGFAGAWHFPTYGTGGEGTTDNMGGQLGNALHLYSVGNGRYTVDYSVAAGTVDLAVRLYHYDPSLDPSVQVLDAAYQIVAGDPIIVNVDTQGGKFCNHRLRIGIGENDFGVGRIDYRGWLWEPGIFA